MPRYRPISASPASARASPARAASDGRFGRLRPARRGDAVRPGERLETAAVPAAAQRPVRVDRLVADLAGRPVVAEMDRAVDGDDPADARAERQSDHRRRTAARPEPQLGEAERSGVVDQCDRQARVPPRPVARPDVPAQSPGMLTRNRVASGDRVVQARDADPERGDRPAGSRGPTRRLVAIRPIDRVRAFGRDVSGPGRDRGSTTSRSVRSTTAHFRFVTPRSIPRWLGHDSPVTRV